MVVVVVVTVDSAVTYVAFTISRFSVGGGSAVLPEEVTSSARSNASSGKRGSHIIVGLADGTKKVVTSEIKVVQASPYQQHGELDFGTGEAKSTAAASEASSRMFVVCVLERNCRCS